jgi:hypothetical protein
VGLFAGIGLFVLLVALVFCLVWWRPNHLVYDKETLAGERDYQKQIK